MACVSMLNLAFRVESYFIGTRLLCQLWGGGGGGGGNPKVPHAPSKYIPAISLAVKT